MKSLALIGGGHAHMVALRKLESFISKGYQVTVVQPSNYHYYSGMGPGMPKLSTLALQLTDILVATRRHIS
jgi:NADH dehydrogenase FAD-containing subunit